MPAALSEVKPRSTDDSVLDMGELSDAGSQHGGPEESDESVESAPLGKTCPWCGEKVDNELLQKFSKGKRLNVRQQSQFCRKHKKKSATDTWEQKGYPQIHWPALHERLAEHSDFLLGLVEGKPSHYRSIHAENIEKGKSRAMKSEDNLIPGYYGPRGFSVMSDYVVGRYGELLKKRAIDDRVIAGRGSAAFIQSVLVAELAVQLIMGDMDVQEEEARLIMEESKRLGEIVNDEE